MKNIFCVFALLIFVSASLFAKPDTALIGRWVARDSAVITEIRFEKGGYITMVITGQTIGGKDYNYQNVTMDMTYDCYTIGNPHNIDITLLAHSSGQVVRKMAGIYEFVSPKQIRVKINLSGTDRPGNFKTPVDEENDPVPILFDKVK